MENVIKLKRRSSIQQKIVGRLQQFVSYLHRLSDSQADYERVNERIQEMRLKYEIYRVRL